MFHSRIVGGAQKALKAEPFGADSAHCKGGNNGTRTGNRADAKTVFVALTDKNFSGVGNRRRSGVRDERNPLAFGQIS